MCGIIYYQSSEAKNVTKPLLKRYDTQDHRGKEGYGYVACDLESKSISYFQREEDEETIVKALESLKDQEKVTNAILFHHRNPTSTPNLKECAHPIVVDHKDLEHTYFVVHNGVISNASEVRTKHIELGYEYTTDIVTKKVITTKDKTYETVGLEQFNDSESLAIDLARLIEGKIDKIDSRGSIAFIVLQATKDYKIKSLYYGRNSGSPLILEMDKHHLCLKSEGHGEEIKTHIIYHYDYASGDLTQKDAIFPSYFSDTGYSRNLLPTKTETHGHPYSYIDDRDDGYSGYGVPSMTTEAYFKDTSLTQFTIQSLLESGSSAEDIRGDLTEEYYLVDDLINWEESLKDDKNVKRLEERKEEIDDMLGDLEFLLGEDDEGKATVIEHDENPSLKQMGFSIVNEIEKLP